MPPVMNTQALATPASQRCTSNIVLSVKNPLKPMNKLASNAPITITLAALNLRINHGVINAPTK